MREGIVYKCKIIFIELKHWVLDRFIGPFKQPNNCYNYMQNTYSYNNIAIIVHYKLNKSRFKN